VNNPAAASTRRVLWVVSEVFGHEENSTGALLEQLVGGLREHYRIEIVTMRPGSATRPVTGSVSRQVLRSGVASARMGWTILRRARKQDVVLGLTNPPLLPAVLAMLGVVNRFRLIVLVHDVYPEALYAVETSTGRLLPAVFDRINSWALRRARHVIVIGRDMQRLVSAKLRMASGHTVLIPNWSDIGEAAAAAARSMQATNPQSPLVIQYSGKMGVTHNPRLLAQTALLLQQRGSPVRLQVYSWGAKLAELRAAIGELSVRNIDLGEPCPRERLPQQLAQGDVGLILMRPGMAGVSVPCRLYNLLAMGKPVIAAVEPESEIGQVVAESNLGWLADPNDPVSLADAICAAEQRRSELSHMGARALRLAQGDFSFAHALREYRRVIDECFARA
jgi:colanic acid biosynthesis glycosyl transferase WcaI